MTTQNPKNRPAGSRRPAKRRGILWTMRRRLRRFYRRHPGARLPVNIGAATLCLLGVVGILSLLVIPAARPSAGSPRPDVQVAAPALDTAQRPGAATDEPATAQPAASDTPLPEAGTPGPEEMTPAPTATQEPAPELAVKPTDGLDSSVYLQQAAPGADYADPESNHLLSMTRVVDDPDAIFVSEIADIHMGSSAEYSALEGVTTFRGSNYRDGGAYGEIPADPSAMVVSWQKRIHGLDDWSGVGWTGQCSLVRWPADLRGQMNINRAKQQKEGLVEVIYATLDGHIYFLDMDDGQETRKAIDIGAPIKGSLTVDPRGVPLLYCGQGIYDVGGQRLPCGTRIWSLIDQKLLYFLDGKDESALRAWAAFDCSPLVDGATDTMITAGENGVLYKVALNTQHYSGGVSVAPEVTRYVYDQTRDGKLGTENSVAIYNHYVYFATNIGIIQCVDLNTMRLVWCFDAQDDIDASLVIEPEDDGLVALYANNELDKRGHNGTCQMFKLNALTGELLWCRDSDPIHQNDDNGGGGFATPAVGKRELEELVYFHICRIKDGNGTLYALDKQTGETVWAKSLGSYGWSSPTCLYSESGKGYVLVGSSNSKLRLLDGLTGQEVASVQLRGNIEGTPAVFGDTIVVGTRSCLIYGIKIL